MITAIITEIDYPMYDILFNDFMEANNNYIKIDGGRNYKSYNDDLVKKIDDFIINNYYYYNEFENDKKEAFNYYLPKENRVIKYTYKEI